MPSLLITGANRGIGLEFVRRFAADGWRVHACCREPHEAASLHGLEGDVAIHQLDVTDDLQVAGLSEALARENIDLLINNAGIYGPRGKTFGDVPFDRWREVFEVNSMAPLRVAERFVEHVARSDRKLIVNIGSRMGSVAENGGGGEYIYRSSKAALNMVSKSMAVDLADRGIIVVVFHPGWVKTDMGGEAAAISVEQSVAGMRKTIDSLDPSHRGAFFSYDGSRMPW